MNNTEQLSSSDKFTEITVSEIAYLNHKLLSTEDKVQDLQESIRMLLEGESESYITGFLSRIDKLILAQQVRIEACFEEIKSVNEKLNKIVK